MAVIRLVALWCVITLNCFPYTKFSNTQLTKPKPQSTNSVTLYLPSYEFWSRVVNAIVFH